MFSLVWAVGGTVDEAGRQLFSKSLRAFLQGEQLECLDVCMGRMYVASVAVHDGQRGEGEVSARRRTRGRVHVCGACMVSIPVLEDKASLPNLQAQTLCICLLYQTQHCRFPQVTMESTRPLSQRTTKTRRPCPSCSAPCLPRAASTTGCSTPLTGTGAGSSGWRQLGSRRSTLTLSTLRSS